MSDGERNSSPRKVSEPTYCIFCLYLTKLLEVCLLTHIIVLIFMGIEFCQCTYCVLTYETVCLIGQSDLKISLSVGRGVF